MIAVTFFEQYGREILVRCGQHTMLTLLAVLIACAVALPLGISLARCRHKGLVNVVMGAVNIIQPIPSLALVALVAVGFYYLDAGLRALFGLGADGRSIIPTLGVLPAEVALVAYALLPILRNTYTGIRQVDPTVIEVATGMGMTRRQILLSVELPLAMPFIMTGIRIATVWTVGVATLVSLIGAGGLGELIFRGLSNYKVHLILAGAGPAIGMALLFDWALAAMEKWLTPQGLRQGPS